MSHTAIADLAGNPSHFPILDRWDFFNHAAVAPLPRVAADALRNYAAQMESAAYLDAGHYRSLEALRASAAALMNATPQEIAFVKNTAEGICTVANGLEWRRGQRIITAGVEYPANIYPWMDIAARHGVELVMVPEETGADGRRRVPLERLLAEAEHPDTRLVALSHVEFASGQRNDLAAVGALCRSRGRLFCVDAIQSLGAVPVDVRTMNIDFLSADGHKWLLAPEGAGLFYCRHELMPMLRPLSVGATSVINAGDYGNYDFTLKSDAARYECGALNVPGLLALKASIELLLAVGIEAVAARLRALTGALEAGLIEKGYRIVSPRGEAEWSGIVSFTSTKHDHKDLVRMLRREHRTEIALREGRLRCSPHFYNTPEQIARLLERLPGH